MANSPNSDSSSNARFFDLFRVHFDAGRGMPPRRADKVHRWTPKPFRDAMDNAGHSIDGETLANWRNRRVVPLPSARDAFLLVFFPHAESDLADKRDWKELEQAWQDAWHRRLARSTTLPVAARPVVQWKLLRDDPFDGLIEFALEEPIPFNDATDRYKLPATLIFGTARRPWQGGELTFQLHSAYLDIPVTSYQIADGMLIGDSERLPNENFTREAGSTKVHGPRTDGCLRGHVLEKDEIIAIVRPAIEGGPPLTARVSAWPTDIDVTTVATTSGTPASTTIDEETRDAVLKALILDKHKRDNLGRVILARRRMTKKVAE